MSRALDRSPFDNDGGTITANAEEYHHGKTALRELEGSSDVNKGDLMMVAVVRNPPMVMKLRRYNDEDS